MLKSGRPIDNESDSVDLERGTQDNSFKQKRGGNTAVTPPFGR